MSNNQSGAVIFQTSNIDTNLYIKEQKGVYQKARRFLATLLMLTFILLPFIQYQDNQAILFDIGAQKLYLFSLILYPQDLMIFVYLFIIAAFALFYVSNRYGRVWCGFMCPQTIWSLLFFWVQFRVEGTAQAQKRLDTLPISVPKIIKKSIKHLIWLTIAFFTATTFISYFFPVLELYQQVFTGQLTALYWGWILTFMLLTYTNAAWIKEKMCEHMCPYSRFQSAMVNHATKQVTYNAMRGEPRAPRKLKSTKEAELGDCVDCNLCVQVCPAGIDIREGFQYECISCALCIDACDQVMSRFNYKKGLIGYQSDTKNSSIQSVGYIALLTLFIGLFVMWLVNRPVLEFNVLKDRNVLYRELHDDRIENTYELKLINKTFAKQRVNINLRGVDGFIITPNKPIEINSDSRKSILVNVIAPASHQERITPFIFVLASDKSEVTTKSVFHGLSK